MRFKEDKLGEVRYHKWFFDLSIGVNHNLAIDFYNNDGKGYLYSRCCGCTKLFVQQVAIAVDEQSYL